MNEEERSTEAWELVGERLSLDFVNTVDWAAGRDSQERLDAYRKLVDWGLYTEALPEKEAEVLRERARRDPDAAVAVVERAAALREALQNVVVAVIERRAPDPQALRLFNGELEQTMPHLRLAPDEDGFHWHWEWGSDALDAVLWPVVYDAAELLTESPSLERVKQCDGPTCAWLFLDSSRNRSRRWCSMESCGNRAKARRYYRRRQREND